MGPLRREAPSHLDWTPRLSSLCSLSSHISTGTKMPESAADFGMPDDRRSVKSHIGWPGRTSSPLAPAELACSSDLRLRPQRQLWGWNPRFLRLHAAQDRQAFRSWFTSIAEAQLGQPSCRRRSTIAPHSCVLPIVRRCTPTTKPGLVAIPPNPLGPPSGSTFIP
jgi:hypothetical protein